MTGIVRLRIKLEWIINISASSLFVSYFLELCTCVVKTVEYQ